MQPLILRLSQSGQPLGWIEWREAVLLYAKDQVLWTLGENSYRFYGGISRVKQARSFLDIDPIVAARGIVKDEHYRTVPLLTNRELFRRDRHSCMYCLDTFPGHRLTRDHVIPVSRGGSDVWTNVVTACRKCNQHKADRLIEETQLQLHAVPYTPNYAEWLILRNRHLQADQMAFLKARCPKQRQQYF
jgi:5-methylcytosine-specific restriction endonuclease McrA